MSKTKENLEKAFAGEAQAHFRYLAFAEQADKDGFPGIARLFRAAAKAETVHGLSHLRVLGTVKGTKENLEAAVEGETFEFKKMYPPMVRDAADEKETEARYSLEYAMSVEMVHAKLLKKAAEDLTGADAYYVCPICGHTVADKAPNKCPYCGADASKFYEVK